MNNEFIKDTALCKFPQNAKCLDESQIESVFWCISDEYTYMREILTVAEIKSIVITHAKFRLTVKKLCEILGISRDAYYEIISNENIIKEAINYQLLATLFTLIPPAPQDEEW